MRNEKTRNSAATDRKRTLEPIRKRRTRQRFQLRRDELERRLALVDEMDAFKANLERERGYGHFLKALRQSKKFREEPLEGLRQLRVARDSLGATRFRRLVYRLGFKRTLVLATIRRDQREVLLERGFPLGGGRYRALEEVSLRDLEGLARRLRKRCPERHPGPPVVWPSSLLRCLRPLVQAWPRIRLARESSTKQSRDRRGKETIGIKMMKEFTEMLGVLEDITRVVRAALEQPGKEPGTDPPKGGRRRAKA